MKSIQRFLFLFAVIGLFSVTFSEQMSAFAQKKQKILIHLTKSTTDIHAAFMAFKTGIQVMENGAEASILLTLEGARIANKNQPLNFKWDGSGDDLETLYKDFVKKGGKIIICPHCTASAGCAAGPFREGATPAPHGGLGAALLSHDKVISF